MPRLDRLPHANVIPADTPAADIVQSHPSLGFDRVAIMRDIDVSFPVDRENRRLRRGPVSPRSAFLVRARATPAQLVLGGGSEAGRQARAAPEGGQSPPPGHRRDSSIGRPSQ
jgi:hypothetical protein